MVEIYADGEGYVTGNEKKGWPFIVQKNDQFRLLAVNDSTRFREETICHLRRCTIFSAAISDDDARLTCRCLLWQWLGVAGAVIQQISTLDRRVATAYRAWCRHLP